MTSEDQPELVVGIDRAIIFEPGDGEVARALCDAGQRQRQRLGPVLYPRHLPPGEHESCRRRLYG